MVVGVGVTVPIGVGVGEGVGVSCAKAATVKSDDISTAVIANVIFLICITFTSSQMLVHQSQGKLSHEKGYIHQ